MLESAIIQEDLIGLLPSSLLKESRELCSTVRTQTFSQLVSYKPSRESFNLMGERIYTDFTPPILSISLSQSNTPEAYQTTIILSEKEHISSIFQETIISPS